MGRVGHTAAMLLLVLTALKMLAEIALLALAGQGVLALLVGPQRAVNPVYRLLQWLTAPLFGLTRGLLPKLPERHLPLACAALLVAVWLLATGLKIRHCLAIGIALCQ